jgi:hypothetical protein
MVEMPKTKEGFECIMKQRNEAHPDYTEGFTTVILVGPDGSPKRSKDKQVICEIQKLALGSETAWVLCSKPFKTLFKCTNDDEIVEGSLIREVHIMMPKQEAVEIYPLYTQIIEHEKSTMGGDRGRNIKGGEACAYPGGC